MISQTGRQLQRGCRANLSFLQIFCKNLHENRRIWTEGRVPGSPWIRHCNLIFIDNNLSFSLDTSLRNEAKNVNNLNNKRYHGYIIYIFLGGFNMWYSAIANLNTALTIAGDMSDFLNLPAFLNVLILFQHQGH